MRFNLILGAVLTVCMTSQSQNTATITASSDCGLYETTDGSLSNGIGPNLFLGKLGPTGGEKKRRVLLKFDLTGHIPSGAAVESAKVVIHVTKVKSEVQHPATLSHVSADWGEGTSNGGENGAGVASTTGDATWIHSFFNSINWTTPGGDFSATASSTVQIGPIGVYTFNSTAAMVSDVQDWLGNASSNFGWIVIGNEAVAQSMKVFSSREDTVADKRPVLIVKYSGPNNITQQGSKPNEFFLHQNYPNPFNPATVIRYSIPASGHVSLKVFDILGNEIATLVDEVKNAGTFTQEWNAAGVPSGLYFYRLTSGNLVSTKKMLLVK